MLYVSILKSIGCLAFFLLCWFSPAFAEGCIRYFGQLEKMLGRYRRIILFATLFLYVALTLLLKLYHPIDGDEVQAWLLARDAGPIMKMYAYMGYEGSPGLWHTILFPFAQSGASFHSVYFLNLAFVYTAIIIWLFFAPFPILVRIVLPFTHIFLTEYAVFARSYALSTCLLFAALAVFKYRPARWGWWSILFFLLANTNIHSTILTCGFALYLLLHWFFLKNKVHGKALLVISAGIALAAIQVLPPADLDPALARFTVQAPLSKVLVHITTGYPALSAFIYALLLIQVIKTLKNKFEIYSLMAVQGVLFSLFLFKYVGEMRHHFFLFFSILMALWINSEENNEKIKTNIFLLCIQFLMITSTVSIAVRMVNNSSSYTKIIGLAIKEQIRAPGNTFIASYPDDLVVTIAAYLPNTRFYLPGPDRWGSFIIWDKKRKEMNFNADVTGNIAALPVRHKGFQNYLYVTLNEIPSDSLTQYNIRELKRTYNPHLPEFAQEWASYYLYQLRDR